MPLWSRFERGTVYGKRGRVLLLLTCALVVLSLGSAASSSAAIAPPWCGTPIPDGVGSLPDGSNPADPVGSFAHIPWYAFACTLADIQSRSNGRMDVQVIGQSALGRDLYLVTLNALDTHRQREDFHNWEQIRKLALTEPAKAQALLDKAGDDVKVPIFVQSG